MRGCDRGAGSGDLGRVEAGMKGPRRGNLCMEHNTVLGPQANGLLAARRGRNTQSRSWIRTRVQGRARDKGKGHGALLRCDLN